jgi:predicted DNA-binding transcriptional regulator AlpA
MAQVEIVFLTMKDLVRILKVSRSTINSWIKDGKFPKPEKFGRLSRWRLEVILKFIDNGFKMTPS